MNANFLMNNDCAVASSNHVEKNNIENNSNTTTADDNKIQFADQKSAINQPTQLTGSPELSSRNAMQENQSTQQVSQSKEIQEALLIEAQKILDKNFKDRDFDFEKFAALNDIVVNPNCRPHSDFIKNAFRRMHNLATSFMRDGELVVLQKENNVRLSIKLTTTDIIHIYNDIISESGIANDDIAYKLYGKLTETITTRLLDVVKDPVFPNHENDFIKSIESVGIYLFEMLSVLPLVNVQNGMQLCESILQAQSEAGEKICKTTTDSTKNANADTKDHSEKIDYVSEFKKLGIFFVFQNEKLAEELLPAARFLTKVGVQPAQFVAEYNKRFDITAGFSTGICNCVLINSNLTSLPMQWLYGLFIDFPIVRHVFYHENIHNVRQAAGAYDHDESISNNNLLQIFKGQNDVISAIKSYVGMYAFQNNEEYIAEFGAHILCCLEDNKNPFDYIKDERLWRLYYEFGGPDFAPIINEKINSRSDCPKYDILKDTDNCYSHSSGYPSKFGIDINQIEDQQVEVQGLIALGLKSDVTIDEQTILPPPPLGYCYEVKNQKLKLKDLKSETYYDPTFCSLTNGPLTLMYAEDRSDPNNPKPLQHHLDLLPIKTATNESSFLSSIWNKIKQTVDKISVGAFNALSNILF